ncbi:MAG: hypothetical protein RLN81_01525 [Balneolaceae bacterium]
MKLISGSFFINKRLIPGTIIFIFSLIGLLSIIMAFVNNTIQSVLIFLFLSLIIGLLNFFLFKKLVWETIDYVYDEDSHLRLIKGDQEDTILLKNIRSIRYPFIKTNPPRAIIEYSVENESSKEVIFLLPFSTFFSSNSIVEDLNRRIEILKANDTHGNN